MYQLRHTIGPGASQTLGGAADSCSSTSEVSVLADDDVAIFGSLLGFAAAGEAKPAADRIAAPRSLRRGCASSRLDHGF